MKRLVMAFVCSVGFLLALTGVSLAGEIVHTTNAHFNEGTLDRVQVVGNGVQLPAKGTALGSWSSATALPQSLRDLKLAYYNERVYVSGGWTGSDYSKAVYYASPGGGWTTESDSLPQAVRDHGMAATASRGLAVLRRCVLRSRER